MSSLERVLELASQDDEELAQISLAWSDSARWASAVARRAHGHGGSHEHMGDHGHGDAHPSTTDPDYHKPKKVDPFGKKRYKLIDDSGSTKTHHVSVDGEHVGEVEVHHNGGHWKAHRNGKHIGTYATRDIAASALIDRHNKEAK